jgi:hypothetical protein
VTYANFKESLIRYSLLASSFHQDDVTSNSIFGEERLPPQGSSNEINPLKSGYGHPSSDEELNGCTMQSKKSAEVKVLRARHVITHYVNPNNPLTSAKQLQRNLNHHSPTIQAGQ